MVLTYRYRVKSFYGELNKQARAVNYVWNFCNDTQKHALKWGKQWLSGFELSNLTAGSSKELRLHSHSINAVCEQYAKSRYIKRRPYLRYRGKQSLGWIPVKAANIRQAGDAFRFYGKAYRVFNPRQLPEGKIKDGCNFSQDARGNWYLNIVIEVAEAPARDISNGIGIDLGLKEFATLSSGEKINNPRHFLQLAEKLAIAQRAKKRRQAAKIHSKITNARRDFHHKLSTRIVREFDYIAVGNVNAAGLAKTNMAKSVNDAGWSSFRDMLAYKTIKHGAIFEEVNEAFSTQTCHECGSIAGPKGQTGLNERTWICSHCGFNHDRDVNAALNILARGSGHRTPVEGTLAC